MLAIRSEQAFSVVSDDETYRREASRITQQCVAACESRTAFAELIGVSETRVRQYEDPNHSATISLEKILRSPMAGQLSVIHDLAARCAGRFEENPDPHSCTHGDIQRAIEVFSQLIPMLSTIYATGHLDRKQSTELSPILREAQRQFGLLFAVSELAEQQGIVGLRKEAA